MAKTNNLSCDYLSEGDIFNCYVGNRSFDIDEIYVEDSSIKYISIYALEETAIRITDVYCFVAEKGKTRRLSCAGILARMKILENADTSKKYIIKERLGYSEEELEV